MALHKCHLNRKSVPVLDHPHGKQFFANSLSKILLAQLCVVLVSPVISRERDWQLPLHFPLSGGGCQWMLSATKYKEVNEFWIAESSLAQMCGFLLCHSSL